jgi:hypothetical protein
MPDKTALGLFGEELNAKPRPRIIYHYTDAKGLKGILESGALWLTDIRNLNDPSELKHGFYHTVKILDRMAAEGSSPEIKQFAQRFRFFSSDNRLINAAHFFITCFSVAGDDLGQWRAYADNGRGFALAFDTLLLEDAFDKAAKSATCGPQTFRLIYSHRKAVRLHAQIINEKLPIISPRDASPRDVLLPTLLECVTAALFFKHKAYRNEAEYRFLELHKADPVPEARHRTRPDGRSVRYREFNWRSNAPSALKKIVVGPAADAQLAMEWLRAHHRGPPVKVIGSPIPYCP